MTDRSRPVGAAPEESRARTSTSVPPAADTATATRCPAIPELWCATYTPDDRDHHGVPWCCRGVWQPAVVA